MVSTASSDQYAKGYNKKYETTRIFIRNGRDRQ